MSDKTGGAVGAKDTPAEEFLERLDAAIRRIEQRREEAKKRKAMEARARALRLGDKTKALKIDLTNSDKVLAQGPSDTGEKPVTTPTQDKKTIGDFLRETDGVDEDFDVVGKAELDEGFDVVRADGPSPRRSTAVSPRMWCWTQQRRLSSPP